MTTFFLLAILFGFVLLITRNVAVTIILTAVLSLLVMWISYVIYM